MHQAAPEVLYKEKACCRVAVKAQGYTGLGLGLKLSEYE